MTNDKPEKYVFPVPLKDLISDSILKGLLYGSAKTPVATLYPTLGAKFRSVADRLSPEQVRETLEQARRTGNFEPLATLVYSILPKSYKGNDRRVHDDLLSPYIGVLDQMSRELSDNLYFKVQETDDNIWGLSPLSNGQLLVRVGKKYIAFKYSISRRKAKNVAVFERLPNLDTASLDEVIQTFHDPTAIESPVLARSEKEYSVQNTVLPFFAYKILRVNC
jgi:hypothetical protein